MDGNGNDIQSLRKFRSDSARGVVQLRVLIDAFGRPMAENKVIPNVGDAPQFSAARPSQVNIIQRCGCLLVSPEPRERMLCFSHLDEGHGSCSITVGICVAPRWSRLLLGLRASGLSIPGHRLRIVLAAAGDVLDSNRICMCFRSPCYARSRPRHDAVGRSRIANIPWGQMATVVAHAMTR